MQWARRLYRSLARALPQEFKIAYGDDVVRLGEDLIDDVARTRDTIGLARLLADLAWRIPVEHLSEMRRDMRYALRALWKSPGFALVGITSIAIGVGLTTMLYATKWQLISRALPGAENASRLVMPEKAVSYDDIEHFREEKQIFAGVAALETGVPFKVALSDDATARPERVFGQIVSPDYFTVLGVRAEAGRLFSAAMDKAGDAPVVVITDEFWRRHLDAMPNAVGQLLRVNGQSALIVGITPKDFHGAVPLPRAAIFVPTTVTSGVAPELGDDVLHRADAREFLAIMCLRAGVTLESAEAALDAVMRNLEKQRPSSGRQIEKGRRVTLLAAGTMVPIPRRMKPAVLGFVAVLMALIMTIACMNLANMLLARGANRRRELAIRLAVGASRARLVRQMVSEGMLLSLLGGLGGFALAYGLSLAKSKLVPPSASDDVVLRPGWQAALFVFALCIVCGIGFSILPALRVTRSDVTPVLKEGSALRLPGHRRFGLRNVLMSAQVMGSVMLLLITGFLVLGVRESGRIRTSFDPPTMFLASVDPARDGYTPAEARAFFEKLPARLRSVGAIRDMALAAQPPFAVPDEDAGAQLIAEEAGVSRVQITAFPEIIGAGYFAVLNEPMLGGREFGELDEKIQATATRRVPVVLSESAAHALFGNGSALGRRVRDDDGSYEVVGVVRDMKDGAGRSPSVIYRPLTARDFARPPANGLTIIVRADAVRDALAGVRREIAAIDPRLTVFDEQSLTAYLNRSRSPERFAMMTYGAIGLFGLILAAIGLAGVTAYTVAQRRKEIGIRMALGARRGQVLWLVLREGAALVVVGTVLGLIGAFALARALSALTSVFVSSLEIGAGDARLLVGAPLLLTALALTACYIPARRATKVKPATALRHV